MRSRLIPASNQHPSDPASPYKVLLGCAVLCPVQSKIPLRLTWGRRWREGFITSAAAVRRGVSATSQPEILCCLLPLSTSAPPNSWYGAAGEGYPFVGLSVARLNRVASIGIVRSIPCGCALCRSSLAPDLGLRLSPVNLLILCSFPPSLPLLSFLPLRVHPVRRQLPISNSLSRLSSNLDGYNIVRGRT